LPGLDDTEELDGQIVGPFVGDPEVHALILHDPPWGDMEIEMGEHKQTRQVAARLARAAGHVQAIKRMVEQGQPCADVLVQIAAVRSALDRAAKVLLADHMEHCVLDSSRGGNPKRLLADLHKALEQFIG
jgi:CsoR family transcriptional regulator, copper-sensing transcriptional repressor